MGQHISSGDTTVTIIHKFSSYPPPGWERNGSLRFHTNSGEKVSDLIHKINEYRSPFNRIGSFKYDNGDQVPPDTIIPNGNVVYYV
jgi:hypothetical protein